MKRKIPFLFCLMVVVGCGNAAEALQNKRGILSSLQAFEPLEAWHKPDPRLRLDQVTYLGSHNSYANVQEGFVYAQQLWSLENQLKRGVRHFLLDIWPYKGQLLLCHNKCNITKLLKAGFKPRTLKSALMVFKNWLDKHPDEIITLELENYVSGDQTYNVIQSVPGLELYILKHTDYEPLDHDGKWPTLQDLINWNKRLIIFDTQDNARYAFGTNIYLVRNMYGIKKAAKLRGRQKPKRMLYQLNYFGTISLRSRKRNRLLSLKELLYETWQSGVVPDGKYPNFIALDFVNKGNAMKWVNELNKKAATHLR